MTSYLLRVHLPLPLEKLLENIVNEYSLGKLKTHSIFERGYEDLNIKLTTANGDFVVKIFSRVRPSTFPQQYIQAMQLLYERGVPVPKLFYVKESALRSITSEAGLTQYSVMEYFDGKSFRDIALRKEDFNAVSGFLAKFHSISLAVDPDYDSWGVANVYAEYQKNKKYLRKEDFSIATSAAKEFAGLDFTKCKRSLVHGDIQREHVLKNINGKYCIIDLGCIANNHSVLDLGIFFAQFSQDLKLPDLQEIIKNSVSEYRKHSNISEYEVSLIPSLMRAQHAAYLIKTSFLKAAGDNSEQTEYWYNFSKRGLEQLKTFTLEA